LNECIRAAVLAGGLVGLAGSARADLVTNGNFATDSYFGWSLSGDDTEFYISGSPGNYAAALTTSTALGNLSQSLATVTDQQYTVSFELAGDGATPNSFTASLGGTTLLSLTNVPDTLPSFTTYTFQYTASASTSLLSFGVLDNPGYLYLAEVSVVPSSSVPEPATILGLGTGLLMVAGYLRSSRRRTA
jgi:hypothetical protein